MKWPKLLFSRLLSDCVCREMKRFTLLFSTIYDTFMAIVWCFVTMHVSAQDFGRSIAFKKTGIMLDQMQYLTLSTVKPFKLITSAC